jgi:hypothetical protein
LGMIQFLAQYIPDLSSIIKHMIELLKKDNDWIWCNKQQQSFNEAKDLIIKAPTLKLYNPIKLTIIKADANSYGKSGKTYVREHLLLQSKDMHRSRRDVLLVQMYAKKFKNFLVDPESFKLINNHKLCLLSITRTYLNLYWDARDYCCGWWDLMH